MPILAKTYQGIQGGMNQAVPQHEIPDGQASYMQDIILSVPGIIKRRGPLTKVSGSATVPFRATGIASVQDMTGVTKIMVLAGGASNANLYFYDSTLATVQAYTMTGVGFTAFKVGSVVDAKSALGLGTIIGSAQAYLGNYANNETGLMYWRGATATANITGVNSTVTVGSNQVTSGTVGAYNGVTAGMFMYTSNMKIFLGTVASVQTSQALTLENIAPQSYGAGLSVVFVPVRPIMPKVMKGRISIAPGSLIVNGTQGPEGTKFKSQGVDALGSWYLYRLSDNALIGQIATITDNATLTISSNSLPAGTGLTNERYYIWNISPPNALDYSNISNNFLQTTVGFLNSVWNGRQWYANIPYIKGGDYLGQRVWFSDPDDFEGLDLSADDGDFMDVGSTAGAQTPITAIQGIPAGLLVFKENELFIITGSDYTNFSVRKMADTGALSNGSVQPVGSGAVWAGREGIFYTDGTSIKLLSGTLGDFWKSGLSSYNINTHQMGSYVWNNQYVLWIRNSFNPGFQIHKGGSVIGQGYMTFCINMDTFAITTFKNVYVVDSVTMPSNSALPTLAIVDDGNTPGTTSVIDTSLIHSATGTGPDTILCGGSPALGPDFYLETKKYDLGDPERKKLFKQIAMNYLLAGDTMAMDTVPGLNKTGTAINTTWATQATWANLRKKFTKRDTHIQFRFYQSSTAVTDVQIGPHAIGFKLQRVGRV